MNENENINENGNDKQALKTCLIFDTHAHYDDVQFDKDREALLESLPAHGVGTVVNVGAGLASTARSVALAGKYPFVYAAAGVHPTEVGELTEQNFPWLASQLDEKRLWRSVRLGWIIPQRKNFMGAARMICSNTGFAGSFFWQWKGTCP